MGLHTFIGHYRKNALIMLNIILKSGQNKTRKWSVFGTCQNEKSQETDSLKNKIRCAIRHTLLYIGLISHPCWGENYLAKATERVSRITVIFTCPG